MLKYLQEAHKRTLEQVSSFYTAAGIHVFVKDPIENKEVNLEAVISKVEGTVPLHLFDEIEMMAIGEFAEFEERDINAFYEDGILHITNRQDSDEDLFDDILHEVAHAAEEAYSYDIYGDQEVKDEFIRKRQHLHDILWQAGHEAPLSFFLDPEYDEEFDTFLYKTIGYEDLSVFLSGLFLSPYAATSLREYFATAFTEFYLDPNHSFLRTTCPELYKKVSQIQKINT